MRVAILGCGAMGTVLGAYMTKNGCNVELIDSYEAHVQALNEKGAHIVGTVDFTVPVKAITPGQMEGIYDVVFLFTKQTANDEVAAQPSAPSGAGQHGVYPAKRCAGALCGSSCGESAHRGWYGAVGGHLSGARRV